MARKTIEGLEKQIHALTAKHKTELSALISIINKTRENTEELTKAAEHINYVGETAIKSFGFMVIQSDGYTNQEVLDNCFDQLSELQVSLEGLTAAYKEAQTLYNSI